MRTARTDGLLLLLFVSVACLAFQSRGPIRPLTSADVDDITKLVMLEDTRTFDEAVLTRILLHSTHPEVRRRAAQTVGRIVDPRGRALLVAARAGTAQLAPPARAERRVLHEREPGQVPRA